MPALSYPSRRATAVHDLLGLQLVVVLGAAVLIGNVAAARLRVAPPVLLLAVGVALAFLPALQGVRLPPDVVLLLFLPALLYWEAITTSVREIRRNLRGVVLMSTLLVAATAAGVAAVAHAVGLAWGPAWVLGAAVAPTDATAVGAFARGLPRRNLTVLKAESLVNDGTALVLFGLAVGATVHQDHPTVLRVSALFLLAYGGGAAAGATAWWLVVQARRRLDDPVLGNLATVLTPFVAFLLAETLHASGVVGAVASGILMSRTAPRLAAARTRQQAWAFWSLSTFVLNAALFVLVGMQAHFAARRLDGDALGRGLLAIALVAVVLVVVRFAFLYLAIYTIRLLDRRPQQRLRRTSNRERVVSGVCGFRGAVSLAAALAVPTVLDSGQSFPDRDLIVFVTAGVVVVTLVGHGLALPAVLRWAALPRDNAEAQERALAARSVAEAALAALPDLAEQLQSPPDVVERVETEYREHLAALPAAGADNEAARTVEQPEDRYAALRLAAIGHKRTVLVDLRDQGAIDDSVLLELQAKLDAEEVRLSTLRPASTSLIAR